MDSSEVGKVVERARSALDSGRTLKGTGFHKAVAALRADPGLTERWADAMSALDREAFEKGVRLRLPAAAGTAILALGAAKAVVALALTGRLENQSLRTSVFFAATGVLLITTHSLTHWVVGRLMGMKFIYYFLGGPPPPRPGAKTDLASYLRTPPKRRALMHASGAVVTKLVPFVLVPVARGLDIGAWPVVALVLLGLIQIVTDAAFSTKSSDWMKVKRELTAARS